MQEDWESKIRQDYKAIVSEVQIQATIDYWRKFIEEHEAVAVEAYKEKLKAELNLWGVAGYKVAPKDFLALLDKELP